MSSELRREKIIKEALLDKNDVRKVLDYDSWSATIGANVKQIVEEPVAKVEEVKQPVAKAV